MSNREDDIEIQIDDPAGAPEVVIEDAPKAKPVEAEEGIEALRAQLAREKAARVAAEGQAAEATRTAYSARAEAHDSNLHLVSNAIDTVRQSNDILKSSYSAAMEAGDYDRAADIQQEMSSNSAKLMRLEEGKQALESNPAPVTPPTLHQDPVEAVARSLTPRSGEWIRRHPEYVTDPRLYQKMLNAHSMAVADGIPVDSDDYFAEVERALRITRDAVPARSDDATEGAARVTQHRVSQAPPSAPVSRDGAAPGQRPNVVRLTKEQAEMAEMMGMKPAEYAKHLQDLKKEGRIH
jgi:hypothetical protein